MEKELTVTCPDCGTILIVDRVTGEILETRRKLVERGSGDRFKDAFQKLDADKSARDDEFARMHQREAEKKRQAERLFNASLDDVKKSGVVEKPRNIFDAD